MLCSLNIAAYEYNIANIPDSLKENAVAVVRNFSATYTQTDLYNGSYKVTKVITILNEKGKGYADFTSYRDNSVDLRSFEGVIRNNDGKEIKKIKKGDLVETNFSQYLAVDTYQIFYEVTSPIYPYTVEYSYEQRFKNGILYYPRFDPMYRMKQSVEKASYRIELPVDRDLRYKTNYVCEVEDTKTDKQHVYTFSTQGIKALKSEPFAPDSRERLPIVKIAPNDFVFDKVSGNMSNWENYGVWVNKLLDGRDNLSLEMQQQVKAIVAGRTDKREIVKDLYKFMQENSRYVNVSLGIGGLQPAPAEYVFKNRFGDCKGLSNVMKAILKVVDIPSNYCEIYSGSYKDLDRDFFDITQTNHAILLVPLEKDSLWLECTSQTLPFGYIHTNIVGHDALVMTEKGGVVCRLPSYSSKDNLTKSTITIDISDNGMMSAKAKFTEYLHGYSYYHNVMESNDRKLHVGYINNNINLPQITIGNINTTANTSSIPECSMEFDFVASNAVNKTGDRLFIPILPLKKSNLNVFNSKSRELDIVLNNGYSEEDSITVNIPTGFKLESMPKAVDLKTPFGRFSTTIKLEEGKTVKYTQTLNVFGGRYSKEQYEAFRSFFQQISKVSRSKIVIKKV